MYEIEFNIKKKPSAVKIYLWIVPPQDLKKRDSIPFKFIYKSTQPQPDKDTNLCLTCLRKNNLYNSLIHYV